MGRLAIAVMIGAGALVGAAPAQATEVVDDDLSCPGARHQTIQQGVNAASRGEQVLVCNGTYREKVRIAGPAKDGVRVIANATRAATIAPPVGARGAVVKIDGADDVQFRRFRVEGPFAGLSCPDTPRYLYGVLVTGGAIRAMLRDNAIDAISDTLPNEGCHFGTGVGVRGSSRAALVNSTVTGYEVAGVDVAGRGSVAILNGNTITAADRQSTQAGVRVLDDAGASIDTNRISRNLSGDGNGIRLQTNTATRTNGNFIFDNTIGMQVVLRKAFINGNFIFRNQAQGLLLTGSSSDNHLRLNRVTGNDLDCEDGTAGLFHVRTFPFYGTLNRWQNNQGGASNPPPLCTPKGLLQPPPR